MWSFAAPQSHSSAPVLSEVNAYSWGSSQISTLYASSETEVIARTLEFDSNQSPGYFFDNGDDVFYNGEYYSRPRQNGVINILVGVSHQDPVNSSLRYNFNFNSAVSVGTSLPAYIDFNRPAGSILEQILAVLSFIALMILIIFVNVVASMIPGVNVIVGWIDVAVISIMTAELLFFGEFGYLGHSEAYCTNKYFRLVYDWVFDWDCNIARLILPGQSYDTVNYCWKPD
ncbi:MAG: hypothetical protein EAX86_08215 [Candidatus Heimdallarchaeota archaeon]|nr:hypothetical protein [Candidatus Heimdallarchaeota archaeon]